MISKNRKTAVPIRMFRQDFGREARVMRRPTTSSITTFDGSLPHCFSIECEAAVPRTVSRAIQKRYPGRDSLLRMQYRGNAAMVPAVPGAFGANPMKKNVAIIRDRISGIGALSVRMARFCRSFL